MTFYKWLRIETCTIVLLPGTFTFLKQEKLQGMKLVRSKYNIDLVSCAQYLI